MTDRNHNLDQLLDDVLMDPKLVVLKDSIQGACRMELARKKKVRFDWIFVSLAAAAVILALLTMFPSQWEESPAPYIVRTQGLPTDIYVKNDQEFLNACAVHTRISGDLYVTGSVEVARVTTPKRPDVEYLSDLEVLGLFKDTPCCLVTLNQNKKSLVFADPEDRARMIWGQP